MKEKITMRRVLAILAMVSFCVATAEGIIFYAAYDNLFFRVLMTLQNSIKAFAFRSDISIADMLSTLTEDSSAVRIVIGYLYGTALFTAPYCTIATLYKLLERILSVVLQIRRSKQLEEIVVFGSGEDMDAFLERTETEKYLIHVVSTDKIQDEKRLHLLKKGVRLHEIDFLNARNEEIPYLAKKVGICKARKVVLFEENPATNFALLQMMGPSQKNTSGILQGGAKVFCRCEDETIQRIIEDYYDIHKNCKWFDLEVVSVLQLQIRAMYQEHPLHSVYLKDDHTPPKDWVAHILLLGFGGLGQQALLQALNLGVTNGENPICIDVVDYRIEEKAGIFSNHFNPDAMNMEQDHFRVKPAIADGQLEIRFHKMDIRYGEFRDLLTKMAETEPFTYVVIALDNSDAAMHCLTEVQRFLKAKAIQTANPAEINVPIMLRMDGNTRLAEYVAENQKSFSNAFIIKSKREVLSTEAIFDKDLNRDAVEFSCRYEQISFDKERSPERRTAEESWRYLDLFRRDSNRALARHQSVKLLALSQMLPPGKDLAEELRSRFGKDGCLLRRQDSAWLYPADHTAFVQALKSDPFAYEAGRMEHRRWCYYMIANGWTCGSQKNDEVRTNPCLVPWDELLACSEQTSGLSRYCKYDFMPLLLLAE